MSNVFLKNDLNGILDTITESNMSLPTRINIVDIANKSSKSTKLDKTNYSVTSSAVVNQNGGGYSATSTNSNSIRDVNKLISMLTSESSTNSMSETSTSTVTLENKNKQRNKYSFSGGGHNNISANDVKTFFKNFKVNNKNVNVKINDQNISEFFNTNQNGGKLNKSQLGGGVMTDFEVYKQLLNNTIIELDKYIISLRDEFDKLKYMSININEDNINIIYNNFNNYKNEIKEDNINPQIIESVVYNLTQFLNYLKLIMSRIQKRRKVDKDKDDINIEINIYISYQKKCILEIQKIKIENEIEKIKNENKKYPDKDIFIQISQDFEKS